MRDLFPACVNVLSKVLRPLHYADLTERAMKACGIPQPRQSPWFKKNIENVREKLLQAGQYETFYTGAPMFAGAFRSWFVSDAQLAMTLDYVEISGSAKAGAEGAFDALMRSPHMLIHNPGLAHTERLNRIRASGLVLEKHVSQWFERRYPEFYADPDNHGAWTIPCSHDFKLVVENRVFAIDVAGPDENGNYGKRGRKRPTDLHFICRLHGDHCLWEGVVRGEGYQPDIDPASIFSPTAFLVWLNCAKHGIPYDAIAPKLNVAA